MAAKGDQRRKLLNETRDVRADKTYRSFISGNRLSSLESVTRAERPDAVERVTFRSLDRQWCIADRRLIDMPRPPLWRSRSDRQVFIMTATGELTVGPALVAGTDVPDLNAFNNRGGFAHPLYRDGQGKRANILPGLVEVLAKAYAHKVTPENFLAYVYGVLAQPAFTERFADELGTRELRVPLTKDGRLFERVAEVGWRLLWLHTYGQRFTGQGRRKGRVPRGAARCTKPVSDKPDKYPEGFDYEPATKSLSVGAGCFQPVELEVYDFEVSGLKVVQSWLGYRMRSGKGKKSSPLDDIRPERWTAQFTTELLELLWVLEATLAAYPSQAQLLAEILESELFHADELPPVPQHMRSPEGGKRPLLKE